MKPLVALTLAFAALLATQGIARANGRFPNALALREIDAQTLVVAGTYGMLVTTNGGRDFAYQCETELFGKPTGSYTVDPLLELGADGAILSGSLKGLRVSRDRSCTFETEPSLPRNFGFFELERPEGAETGEVVDLCRRGAGPTDPVLALVSLQDDAGTPLGYRLYQADTSGVFAVVGGPISTELMDYGFTLEVATSDPERIYVTGSLANDPVLLASADGGEHFEMTPLVLADPDFVLGAYLGAVSPNDPERLYLRVARRVETPDGLYQRDDSLAVSDDGGASVTEVLRAPANLLGFALSPDGGTVLAGYGDPRVDETLSSPDAVGIYRGDAGSLAFDRIVADLDVSCLRWTENGIYACATERDPLGADPTLPNDFHLGVARAGIPASLADFTPLLKLKDVRGPAPWADGRTTACEAEWTSGDPAAPVPSGTCARLNACNGTVALSPGALVCGASSGGTAGGPGNGGSATGGSSAKSAGREPGCTCRLASRRDQGDLAGSVLVQLILVLTVSRRLRRRSRPPRLILKWLY